MYYSKYRNRETGNIISREQLRELFYNTSFPPSPWPQAVYDYIGYDPIIETTAPIVDDLHEAVSEGIIQNSQGQWTTNWIVKDRFSSEKEKKEYLNQYKAQELIDKWDAVRKTRDVYIRETDFTQLPDTPITDKSRAEFVEYRKQLRNITNQPDPFDIMWPEKPQYIKS